MKLSRFKQSTIAATFVMGLSGAASANTCQFTVGNVGMDANYVTIFRYTGGSFSIPVDSVLAKNATMWATVAMVTGRQILIRLVGETDCISAVYDVQSVTLVGP